MSAQRFFISGLPRSRSAWLSVFCTTDRTVCYHEPTANMESLDSLDQIYDSRFYSHVGVADSGLGFHAEEILARWAPRTLIVERSLAEVEASLGLLGLPPTNYAEVLLEHLQRVRSHPLVMWVDFYELSERRVAERAFRHLLPGLSFDEARFDLLDGMRIECDPIRTMAAFARNAENLANMLRHVSALLALKERSDATVH